MSWEVLEMERDWWVMDYAGDDPELIAICDSKARAEEIVRLKRASEPQTIETAPRGPDVLVWWPQHADGHEELPDGATVGGAWTVSSRSPGSSHWNEPDWISGHGDHLDSDWCWADEPTHWAPLPHPPALAPRAEKGGAT